MFNIKYDLAADIAKVSKMLGVSESDFVNSVLERELVLYRDPITHKIEPKRGEYLANRLECNLNPETEQVWKPWYILYKRTMYTYPYISIIADGKFISTPADGVKVSGEQSEVNK